MAISLTRLDIEAKLTKAFPPEQAASLVDIFDTIRQIELERAADTQDLKRGLTELTEEVKKLAVAQQHTDERIAELAEAQRQTDESLRESIQRTDQRFAELAEAQRQTDENLGGLTQRFAELAEAQRHTDESVQALARTVDKGLTELRQAVGSLANTFGFNLEEFVAALLPPYLERHGGIMTLALAHGFFEVGAGQTEEIDLVGNGQRDGQQVTVLVECRTTVGGSEIRRLAKKLDSVVATLAQGEVVKIVVAMNLHPTGAEAAKELDIWAIPYSRINRERMEI